MSTDNAKTTKPVVNHYVSDATETVLFSRRVSEDVEHNVGSKVYPRMGMGFDFPPGPEPIYEVLPVETCHKTRRLIVRRVQ